MIDNILNNNIMFRFIILIIFIVANIGFAQLNLSFNIEDAKRDDGKLYLWIFFKDKYRSLKKVTISKKTFERRNKVDTERNYDWYDLKPSSYYINQIASTGAKIRGESRWFNAASIECYEKQLTEISSFSFVKEIQPIMLYKRTIFDERINSRAIGKSLDINNIDYGGSYPQLEQINVPAAHDAGFYGEGVKILVIDSGFNLDHPVFDSLSVIAEWDVINDDSTTKNEDGQDIGSQQNHGTSVLSIIGGYTPGTLIGPAYKADYILAKTEYVPTEQPIEEDYFVQGLEWGESLGADVVTTSVGYLDWYSPNDMDGNTALVTKAYDKAASLGMVCVASVGNENNNYWDTVTPPADADSVISVGAVDANALIAYFSSQGPSFDGRRKPEVCAWGVDTYSAVGNVSYLYRDGTSFAAPLVAGAAALILNANPNWNPMLVRDAMIMTASRSNSPDNIYGWGILDTWAAINYSNGNVHKPDLKQNYRNPFKSSTTIEYELQQSAKVKLKIYNILGQEIITLIDRFEPSGNKTVVWNGCDASGKEVSSGIYIYTLIVGDSMQSNKMVLIN
jgi:hypothetical protein